MTITDNVIANKCAKISREVLVHNSYIQILVNLIYYHFTHIKYIGMEECYEVDDDEVEQVDVKCPKMCIVTFKLKHSNSIKN